jgi:ribosomal protein S18 acetylase RimI-like enzyme
MIAIGPLNALTLEDLRRTASGYISAERYRVEHTESDQLITFDLKLEALAAPYVKKYAFDEDTMAAYKPLLGNGFTFGVFAEKLLIGLAISEVYRWNNSLWIHDFHIAEEYRGRGLGRQLMHAVENAARQAGIRIIACETQNKNVPAINFYRRIGFSLEGIDLSHYRNSDHPDGEIAVFMKMRLI